ncbi:MAG: hypothetical protein IT552_02400 [Sphingomonadaceae bacterium]|nr:hypothetical protein [Sphingomonadaceae bacterium]
MSAQPPKNPWNTEELPQRVDCTECHGSGLSPDPMWKNCFTCCGLKSRPTCFDAIQEDDIGRGVGFRLYYHRNGDRSAGSIFGDLFEKRVGTPPLRRSLRSEPKLWDFIIEWCIENRQLESDDQMWDHIFLPVGFPF